MRWVITLGLLILVACTSPGSEEPVVNETPEDYGELLHFTFASNNLTLEDAVVVTGVNTTSTVHLFTYCDIPAAFLIKLSGGAHRHVFPHVDECVEPGNTTFSPNLTIPLSSVPTRAGGLQSGEYLVKLFYSTLGPHQYMREHNEVVWISQ